MQLDIGFGVLVYLHLHIEYSAAKLYDSTDSVGIVSELASFRFSLLSLSIMIFTVVIGIFLLNYHLLAFKIVSVFLFFFIQTLVQSCQLSFILTQFVKQYPLVFLEQLVMLLDILVLHF